MWNVCSSGRTEWALLLSSALPRHFRVDIFLVKGRARDPGIPFTLAGQYMAGGYGGMGGMAGWPGSISSAEGLLVTINKGSKPFSGFFSTQRPVWMGVIEASRGWALAELRKCRHLVIYFGVLFIRENFLLTLASRRRASAGLVKYCWWAQVFLKCDFDSIDERTSEWNEPQLQLELLWQWLPIPHSI